MMNRTIPGSVLAAWLGAQAHAQSAAKAEEKLEFEVASIKASAAPRAGAIRLGQHGGPGSGDPGRLTYTLSTIRDLIVDAYGVKRSQVSGGPNWLDSERFDIVAKIPNGATREQVEVMPQNLLAERFRLALHRETRELPIYVLVVGAKGPKLKDSSVADTTGSGQAGAPPPPFASHPGIGGIKMGTDGCPATPPAAAGPGRNFTIMTPNGECLLSNGQTMDGLAKELSSRFDRPVIDQTGLNGKYDLRLRYDPSSVPGGRGSPIGKDTRNDSPPVPSGGDPADRIGHDGDPPSIFTALQEQLGLHLEAKKGPVPLLVIDHVEKRPTPN